MVEISAVYGVFVFDGRANYSLRVVSVSVSEFGCRDTREIHTMLADCCFLILRIVHLGSCESEAHVLSRDNIMTCSENHHQT